MTVEGKSALELWQPIANQLGSILSAIDVDVLDPSLRRTVTLLKRLMVDARLDVRDYEFSDSRAELIKHSHAAAKRLEKLRKAILTASEHNLVGAVDVAQLSAEIDRLIQFLGVDL